MLKIAELVAYKRKEEAKMMEKLAALKKVAHVLTAADRDKIKKKNFALPEEEKYPIEDKQHAINAIQRVEGNGTPVEQKEVISKALNAYPSILKNKLKREE